MTTCSPEIEDPFRCPTKWELWRQILKLLPRGRAWQTHDTAGEMLIAARSSEVGTFEVGATALGVEPSVERLTVAQQFWAAYAEVLEHLHQRACALIDEFYCSSIRETTPEWWHEFGFPDDCDPWPNLCAKVRAEGGATCAYLQELAASRGWVLTCSDCGPAHDGSRAGVAAAGCARACGCPGNTIYLTVHLDASPSFARPTVSQAQAGLARAGSAIAAHCPPSAEPLLCLIERFKPAHVRAVYIYVGA